MSVPVDDVQATDDVSVDAEYQRFWFQMLTSEENHVWIAEDSSECLGFLAAGSPPQEVPHPSPVLKLIGLYLVPEAWGTGIANSLHQYFVQLLIDTPTAQRGVLDVWDGNQRAQTFYRRHGWIADDRTRPGPGGKPFIGLGLATPK